MSGDRRRRDLLQSLREQGITDESVLQAIGEVPREAFVERPFADQAYADQALPISCGQTISQPYIVALMTEALRVEPAHRVLEIGTGSGYQAAVLSRLCRRVYTIERYRTLSEQAGERFRRLGLTNITQQVGDGSKGMPTLAPFDRIIVTAAAQEAPQALLDQLSPGGVMVVPLEERPGRQSLWRITRDEQGFAREHLTAVRFVPLVEGLPREG
ncbi:protein-L-isoaspartate(D-aspartate) O-methyltransferase [Aestuariivirga sp.]|uniref:protein-L-isoaspartate(D-aspartate) O-methyltransferase n=1 Tax=Aestuariivirga sp. TaxID=2650926 RepID=UPI003918C3FF